MNKTMFVIRLHRTPDLFFENGPNMRWTEDEARATRFEFVTSALGQATALGLGGDDFSIDPVSPKLVEED